MGSSHEKNLIVKTIYQRHTNLYINCLKSQNFQAKVTETLATLSIADFKKSSQKQPQTQNNKLAFKTQKEMIFSSNYSSISIT